MIGIEDDDLASRFVGRWPSGTPLMRSLDADIPAMGDQPLSNSNFLYIKGSHPTPLKALKDQPDPFPVAPGDSKGAVCPFAGHLRKMQPRDFVPGDASLHRIIRRGSPYGTFINDRYTPDGVDRGLLFMSYQSSITQVKSKSEIRKC